jgi:hypothetical protein
MWSFKKGVLSKEFTSTRIYIYIHILLRFESFKVASHLKGVYVVFKKGVLSKSKEFT